MIIEQDKFITITKEQQEEFLKTHNIEKNENDLIRGYLYYNSTTKTLGYQDILFANLVYEPSDEWFYVVDYFIGTLEEELKNLKDVTIYTGEKIMLNDENLSKIDIDSIHKCTQIYKFREEQWDECIKFDVKDWTLRIFRFYINPDGLIREHDHWIREIPIPHNRKIKSGEYKALVCIPGWNGMYSEYMYYRNQEDVIKFIRKVVGAYGINNHKIDVDYRLIPTHIYERD